MKLALLDRDGTLIDHIPYLSDPAQVRLLPGVVEGLRGLRERGFYLVMVSNQSGLGRGYFELPALTAVNQEMQRQLGQHQVELDLVLYCPHAPQEECQCRKPRIGLAEQAARQLDVELESGLVVGDSRCDIELAQNLGWPAFLMPDSSPERAPGLSWQRCTPYQPGFVTIERFDEVLSRLA